MQAGAGLHLGKLYPLYHHHTLPSPADLTPMQILLMSSAPHSPDLAGAT